MKYTFEDHLHNFAVWTAARAVQRGFTNTRNIKEAIEKTNLKVIAGEQIKTSDDFDKFHKECCDIICDFLNKKKLKQKTTFGRAAKIVAIYLKTSVVIRDSGKSVLAQVIHPPLDSILLQNLEKHYKKLKLSNVRWTQLDESRYKEIINALKKDYPTFWEIERYWDPTRD